MGFNSGFKGLTTRNKHGGHMHDRLRTTMEYAAIDHTGSVPKQSNPPSLKS